MSIQLIYPLVHHQTGDPKPHRTQKYGVPTSYGYHEGTDYAAYVGQPIWAAAPGKVVRVKYDMAVWHNYGIHCWVEHENGYWTAYCHLSRLDVQLGQVLQTRQQLGQAGSTGNSTGPHLHWNLTLNQVYLDPEKYLAPVEPPAIPPDAKSTYRVSNSSGLNVRQSPSKSGLRLTTLPSGSVVYLNNQQSTDDAGYHWLQLASPQNYKGVDISGAWLALDYTVCQVTTYGTVSLLE